MRLSKKVLTDESFKQELPKLAVLLNADFPQRKKLPPAVTHQNDSLAAIYNEKGLYPHIVLIHSSIPGSYRELVYTTQSAAEFIADIKKTRSAIAP
jgi:thiamine biosynthesis lipoprotein